MSKPTAKLNLTSDSVDSVTFSGGIGCVRDAAAYLLAAKLSLLICDDIRVSVDGWTADITVSFGEGAWVCCGSHLRKIVKESASVAIREAVAAHAEKNKRRAA